jgi:transposase
VAAHRDRWRVWQRDMDPTSFIVLDETGATTNMVCRYGWGPKGERLVDAAPHGHWRTTTFIAGLRALGPSPLSCSTGSMTGEAFRAYVEQFLAPSLSPGDVVVMENLAAHKVAGVARNGRRSPPPGTPASSIWGRSSGRPTLLARHEPVELMFAKLKALLRSRREQREPASPLGDAPSSTARPLQPSQCATYIRTQLGVRLTQHALRALLRA